MGQHVAGLAWSKQLFSGLCEAGIAHLALDVVWSGLKGRCEGCKLSSGHLDMVGISGT